MHYVSVLAMCLCLAGILMARVPVIPPVYGFGVFVLGGVLGLGTCVFSVIALIRGSVPGWPVLLGVPGAMMLVVLVVKSIPYPLINDISTDLIDPPQFASALSDPANRGRDMSFPKPFAETIAKSYPDITTLRLAGAPEEVFARVRAVLESIPSFKVTRVDESSMTIDGVATTSLFQFRDDVVVRVEKDGDGSAIDLRSKSRVGKGDLGANAARIRKMLLLIKASAA